jgi:hypothetical protein
MNFPYVFRDAIFPILHSELVLNSPLFKEGCRGSDGVFLLFFIPPHILKNKQKQNKLIFPIKNFIKAIKPLISPKINQQNKANKNDKLTLRRL